MYKSFYAIACLLFLFACADPYEDITPSSAGLPSEVAELEAIIQHSDTDAGTKLQAYWQLYKALRYTEPEKAINYLDQQGALAIAVGNKTFEGLSFQGKGIVYQKMGMYDQAVGGYSQAITVFEKEGDYARAADQYNNTGYVFMSAKAYNHAIGFLEEAVKYYEESNDFEFLANTCQNIGTCYYMKPEPDYVQARHYLTKSIEIQKAEINNINFIGKLYNQLGVMNIKASNYQEAITNYQEALTYFEEDNNTEQVANMYYNIAEAYVYSGDAKEAENWLNKATNLQAITNTIPEEAIMRLNIVGKLMQLQGRNLEAVQTFQEAIALANQEAINQPLQNSLELMEVSYNALIASGEEVSAKEVLQYEAIEDTQMRLQKDFEAKVSQDAQAQRLLKQIEIHDANMKALKIEQKRLAMYRIAGIIGVLAIALAVLFIWNRKQLKVSKQQEQEMLEIAVYKHNALKNLKEGMLEMIDNHETLPTPPALRRMNGSDGEE